MKRTAFEEALWRLAHGPFGEAPLAVGRVPGEILSIALGWCEPREVREGEVTLAPSPGLGPAYALGGALLAHPDAFPAEVARRLGMRGQAAALAGDRSSLRKLAVFVPRTHLHHVRDALTAAGAGAFGGYRDCTFATEGTGTFLPLEGADPFIGRIGEREEVPEARLETAFPAYLESRVLRALRESHPYEEPAYDVYGLQNPEPTYGGARLGTIAPVTEEHFPMQVREALDAKNLRWSGEAGREIARVLVLGDPRLAGDAASLAPYAVVSPPLLPWDAAGLAETGCVVVEVEDFLGQALAHLPVACKRKSGLKFV